MNKSFVMISLLPALLAAPIAQAEPAVDQDLPSQQAHYVERARVVFAQYLSGWNLPTDPAVTVTPLFSVEARLQFRLPESPDWTLTVDGADAIAEYVVSARSKASDWIFSDVQYFPTLQANVVFVQFDASAVSRLTGKPLHYSNTVVLTLDGDHIVRLHDFNGAQWGMRDLIEREQTAQRSSSGQG